MSVLGTSCIQGFQSSPTTPGRCVPDCPTQQGFELQVRNGIPACVYKTNASVYFTLKNAPGLGDGFVLRVPTLTSFANYARQTGNTSTYNEYKTAKDAYDKDSAVALERVGKSQQLADAFAELQTAENVRDKSPQAYQDARVRYYTLLNGEGWLNEETARITNAEALPKVAQYLATYQDLNTRVQQQQKTSEVVTGVKDKLISMKDDFKMTTDVFSKQIAELKNQIEIEKKAGQIKAGTVMDWMGFLLNVLLVVTAIAAAFVLIRKLLQKQASPAYTTTSTVR
jgi:hypothetical protein